MKSGIHPNYVETTVSCTCGATFTTRSTAKNGVIHADVCSQCHPFYTGKQKILDTGGRVPTFTFNPISSLLFSNDNGTGPIPTSDLSLYPRHQGVFIAIRYSGNGAVAGKLHLVDPETRQARVVPSNLTTVRWSRVRFVSHDDLIALEPSPLAVGAKLAVDIEVVRVQPGDRLRGRYERDL